jgi:hypothetical protein
LPGAEAEESTALAPTSPSNAPLGASTLHPEADYSSDLAMTSDDENDDDYQADVDWSPLSTGFQEACGRLIGLKLESRSILAEKNRNSLASEEGDLRFLDFMKLRCIQLLFCRIQRGEDVMTASRVVVEGSFESFGSTTRVKAMSLRRWARHFLLYGTLPPNKTGKHQKTSHWFADEDIKRKVCEFLNETFDNRVKGNAFTALTLKNWVQEVFGREISERTALRSLHILGYEQSALGGLYIDGHEREDVVKYREGFVKRHMGRSRLMLEWHCDEATNLWTPIPPNLGEGERELVMITHDECVARSNDVRTKRWGKKGESFPKPKGLGQGYMASGFLAQDGPLKISAEQARQLPALLPFVGRSSFKIITVGKDHDGYWTGADLIKQVEDEMTMFDCLNPSKRALFMFDNSSNHQSRAPDALDAMALTLKDGGGGKRKRRPRDGWFMRDDIRVVQPMVFEDGSMKGLKTILSERNLWTRELTLGQARLCLSRQPDFASAKSWLEETIHGRGHLIDFYPKFHCELNWIERVWGWTKKKLRATCDFQRATLRCKFEETLLSIPTEVCRRFYRRALRYIDAYVPRAGGPALTLHQIAHLVKKYKSHRRCPESVFLAPDIAC